MYHIASPGRDVLVYQLVHGCGEPVSDNRRICYIGLIMRSQGHEKRPSDLRLESGLDLMASRPKLRVLRYLARRGERLTGREIARGTGSAWARTSKALKDMVDAGLLIHRRVGRAIEYHLNEQHYLIHDILLPAF